MKKICFITTVSLTMNAFILDIAKYFAEDEEYEVTLICSPDEEFEKKIPYNINFIPVSMKRGISLDSIFSIIKMTRIFLKYKFDLVQYSTPNAALYASIASKYANIPIRVYHLMGFRYLGSKGIKKNILKYLEKFTCHNSTNIECVSKSNMDLGIKESIFSKEKVQVIWNGSTSGVNLTKFNYKKKETFRLDIRKKFNFTNDDIVFCFAGRITKDKGIDEIFQAFEELDNPHKKLLLIGSNEGISTLNSNLYKKAKQDKNIIFHSFVDDIVPYYCAIDVLLLPSYREGFGNILIEAQAMGIPVITSNIPGPIDAMINNETGILIEPRNKDSLKKAMLKMCNSQIRNLMSLKAISYVESNFDQKELLKKIKESKNKLLESQN